MDEQEANDEYKAVTSVLSSFHNFHTFQLNQLVSPRLQTLATLTSRDQLRFVPWYEQHTQFVQQCIEINRDFCQHLAEKIGQDWGVNESSPTDWTPASPKQFAQTQIVLSRLMREWSDQGEQERQVGHDLIISHLNKLYPDKLHRQGVKVLVPSCGLGRLVFELVMQGYWTQGNNSDYHTLFISNFILNHCQFPHSFSIFPFLASSATSSKKRRNQIRPVTIPDVSPTAEILSAMEREKDNRKIGESATESSATRIVVPFDELMSITAGSFTELYGSRPNDDASPASQEIRSQSQGEFDVVVTEFCLHSASTEIIDYVQTINNVLKQGGKWINFGPLSGTNSGDDARGDGLDLSRDDLFELVTELGFEFATTELDIETTYCGDARSLESHIYKCDFWVCTKVSKV
ncbi:hypothetical protein KGF57_004379 [Candida theae]|uniref:carnosine N-methyltransferase n=1 Tax=Candida theae TaxID=1198502 RepID=A0AAD5FX63_9ASCO|nr:uncharacterized protein KGF57_004379 [Candida theae]KAI5950212.1 hypothetical protein KGF57_004379 [Candida theae]